MLCATTSCSSRAIPSRSSATALFAACCCSVTTYRRRCRTEYPVIQAMTRASATGTNTPRRRAARGRWCARDADEHHDAEQQRERGEPGPLAGLDRHRVEHERGGKEDHRGHRGPQPREQHAEDHERAERGHRGLAAQCHRDEDAAMNSRTSGTWRGAGKIVGRPRPRRRSPRSRRPRSRARSSGPAASASSAAAAAAGPARFPGTRGKPSARPAVVGRIRHVAFGPHRPRYPPGARRASSRGRSPRC